MYTHTYRHMHMYIYICIYSFRAVPPAKLAQHGAVHLQAPPELLCIYIYIYIYV